MTADVFVTGATGTIGAALVRLLAERGVGVRALSRDPERGERLPGLEWVEGDLADRGRLGQLLAGADRLFLLVGNVEEAVRLQKNALRAAREAGVYHVVKLSALGASEHSRSLIGTWHWIAERHVVDSGLSWTLLRPHHFAQNLLAQRDSIVEEGVVRSPSGDGRIPFVDTRDIAAVAAEVLTGSGHAGRTYTLTGPEAVSYRQVTEMLAEETGRPLRFVDEPAEEYRARRLAAGDPDWLVCAQLAIFAYQRAGGPTAQTTETVAELLGRPARSVRDFLRDHAGRFVRRP